MRCVTFDESVYVLISVILLVFIGHPATSQGDVLLENEDEGPGHGFFLRNNPLKPLDAYLSVEGFFFQEVSS